MELGIQKDIQSIAWNSGWEVDPVFRSDGDFAELSSALHSFTAVVSFESGKGFSLSFPSSLLHTEMERIYVGFSDNPISHADTLRTMLRKAAVLAGSLPNSPVFEFEKALSRITFDETAVRREVEQRVGQVIYRKHLLQYWNGHCALTGISEKSLLKASHAKPWKDCKSAEERLSVFNGFLLEARFDALFDVGLITFDNTGLLLASETLSFGTKQKLGIVSGMKLRWIREEHLPYLHWHQSHVFSDALSI